MCNCYKLEIFIPEDHFVPLQQALQEVDAGHIGNYDSCLSYSRVMGTWRPLEGTNPYIGSEGEISREAELKVEVTVRAERLAETLAAVRNVHPYEEPVINVIQLTATGMTGAEAPAFNTTGTVEAKTIVATELTAKAKADRSQADMTTTGALPADTPATDAPATDTPAAEPEEQPPVPALLRENVVFFWNLDEDNEEFSNWYRAPFTLEGIQYWCTEQYFMAKKALLCGDTRAYNAIMSERTDPSIIKMLGKKAAGFAAVKDIWDGGAAMEVMFNANMAKFRQNPELKEQLLATGDKLLAEASPKDETWGIGVSADDPLALCPDHWPGKNQQGRVLMLVRRSLT